MKSWLLLFVFFSSSLSFAQLWQNDFGNSSDWISTDLNTGTDSWIINSSAIGGDVDSINSSSAGNGFAQFNSEGQCIGDHQDVVLTYFQPIDITASELSYIEFVQHYKRKKDSVYVEFSNDGLTWESVRINQEYWYYQETADPDTVRVSVPASVQSQPFYLRFRFSGECGFAWLIDDVKIFEKDEFALAGIVSFRVNEKEYYSVNHCLIDTLDLHLSLSNTGFDTLFSVVVQTELFEDGVLIEFQTDTIDQILPEEISIVINPNLYPLASWLSYADYTTKVKLYSLELDTVLLVDTLHYTYYETIPSTPESEGALLTDSEIRGAGYSFVVPQNGEGVYCSWENYLLIPPQTSGGQLFFLLWFKQVNGVWTNFAQSEDFIIPTTLISQEWMYIYSVAQYQAGDTGLVMVASYGDVIPLAYGQKSLDSSVYLLDNFYQPFPDIEGHAPLIKMTYGYIGTCTCLIGIEENQTSEISIIPNPATDHIQFANLTESISQITIYSPEGKWVYSQINPLSNSIPVSALISGMYLVQIETVSEKVYFSKFIKE